MSNIVEQMLDKNMSRKAFLAATSASLAGLAMAGCQPASNALEESEEPAAAFESEGKWIPTRCWLNCGGGCYHSAYVVDGVVKYQKTDDLEEDTLEHPQQRGCVRGRSLRHMVYAPDRIRYPMKRKGWSLDNPNGEMRGKDEWERISWDEALDYVTDALKKAIAEAGNRSILHPNWDYYHPFQNALNAIGGMTLMDDTGSSGTYQRVAASIGLALQDMNQSNDRYDLLNSDTIILYACNPAWASPGQPNWYLWQAKEAGIPIVMVGPSYNASADLFDAKWIRVRPGTDTAFLLAVAYTMITEDDNGSLIDWDFLDRCTVGFDMEHLPADAKVQECFKDYVLGEYDGVPKTPEWAAEICGTPLEDIAWFAHEVGCKNNVSLLHSFPFARFNDTDDISQLFLTVGAMGGHIGKSGNATGSFYHSNGGNGGPSLVTWGAGGTTATIPNPVDDNINAADVWNAVLSGKYVYHQKAFADPSSVEERDIDVRVIYVQWRNPLQTVIGTKTGIEAFRKVDCVVTQGYDFNATAQYSDILLPVQTPWERDCFATFFASGGREAMYVPSKVIEPLWEARSDDWIGIELLKRFDIDPSTVYQCSEEQGRFNGIAGAMVLNENGVDYEPLVTITQDTLSKFGFEGTPQEGRIPYEELVEKGKYQVSRTANDNYGSISFEAFRNDPDANPVATASGKFEIYCQTKADAINAMSRSEVKPYPTYRAPLHGYEESFSDWESKTKGEYPYQMYNPHYLRRAHTGFENIPQLREVMPNPAFINASDAAEKGVEDGDTVLIYNSYAKVLRHASLTERIMPGCIALPHGTWLDLTDDEEVDLSGSDNWMIAPETSGCGVSGYNSNLVNFEKWDGEALRADSEVEYGPVGGIE